MRKSNRPLIIASRASMLARLQARMVGRWLSTLDASLRIDYRWIESEGDRAADVSFEQAGGKGLFVRAVERALLDQQADLAVHSLKDLPSGMTAGLAIAAVPRRADVRDCLISAAGYASLDELPQGATVGTASPRRAAQLRHLRPDVTIGLLRGNIETRLRRVLEERRFDATLLAMAGLERGGLSQHARFPIAPEVMLPAACQGALALQCRVDDHVTLRRCLPLNDPDAATAVHAERQLVAGLGGDCHSPIAALAEPAAATPQDATGPVRSARQDRGQPHFRLRALVLAPDGSGAARIDHAAPIRQISRMVRRALADLHAQGAAAMMARR